MYTEYIHTYISYIYIHTVYIRLSWLGAIWPSNPMLQSSFKTPPAGSAIELGAIAANVMESKQCPSRGAYIKYLKEMRHITFREIQRWWYGRKFRWCWCHVIVLTCISWNVPTLKDNKWHTHTTLGSNVIQTGWTIQQNTREGKQKIVPLQHQSFCWC